MITPLYLTSTITNAAAPFTVGHPFVKGQVPAGSGVIADIADFQCIPKTYWEDGSLKFAILSGRASLTANVEKTVTLDVGTVAAGTALTIADLKAVTPTVSIALTSPKDWTFGTAAQTVGARLTMSNALDIFDAAASTITADNGATVGAVTMAQDAGTANVVMTAPLSGGTVGGYQTVKYRVKYKVKRNISAITAGVTTRITVTGGWKTTSGSATDGLGVSIAAIGDTITFADIVGMIQLNGLTGTVTARDTTSARPWVEVNIDSTAFTAYTSGGTATKNELNTSDAGASGTSLDTVAYVRTGGGLEWNGTTTTYSAVNSTGQTSVSWATTDWDTPFEVLESGPKMSSWKYRKAITPDPHMVAWLEVRLYAGGAVQILPYVENGMLKVERPTAKQATFVLTINTVEKFNSLIELKSHTRTVLINGTQLCYWTVTDPNVVPRHSREYIYATRLIPTYANVTPDTATTITSAAPAGVPTTFAPFDRCNLQAAMGAAGWAADIGLIPNHDALYFTNGSRKSFEGMVRNGFATGRYRIHYRDEAGNWHRPLRFSQYPNLVMNGKDAGMSSIGISSTLEYTPTATGGTTPAGASSRTFSSSHHPSMGYVPYMITGWNYFLEEMQFLSTLLYLKQVNTERVLSKGILRPEAGANQTRGAAWALRSLTQAATLGKDGDTLTTELRTSLTENILLNHAKYVAVENCPFGFMELYTDYNSSASTGMWGSGFQTDFMTAAIGFMKNADPLLSTDARTKLAEFFAWKAKSAIGRLGGTGATEWLYRDSGAYEIPLSPNQLKATADRPAVNWDASKGPTGPWYSSWGELWDIRVLNPGTDFTGTVREDGPLRDGNFPTPGSYQANLLPAIAYAVEHGVPGALAAYNRLTGASNWSLQNDSFVAYPVYGIKPASMTAVEVPVPTPVTTPRGKKVRVAKTGLVSGKIIMGITGFGILAEDIPEIGTDGPGLNFSGLSFPADAGKEIRIEPTLMPAGDLVIDSKYGATYSGASSAFKFNVFEENVLVGESTYTFNMGGITITLGAAALTQATTISSGPISLVPANVTTTATINLVNPSGTALTGLASLKWAWFDQSTPGGLAAPTDQGTIESSDAQGVVVIELPNSVLASGDVGWLIISDSDGSPSSAYKSMSGPVMVD